TATDGQERGSTTRIRVSIENRSKCRAAVGLAGVHRRHHPDVMIGESERRVQLHARHVAIDAIAAFAAVRMGRGSGVARLTFRVIVRVVVSACILMRYVASGASEMPACETAALHQPERLKADVFRLVPANRRLDAMAGTAKFHLRFSGELARIHGHSAPLGMLRRARMTPLALHSGDNWFQMLVNLGRVTCEARPRIALALLQT